MNTSTECRADIKYPLIDKILELACESKLKIFGPYVRDVLAYRKNKVPVINLDVNFNLWARSKQDWNDFMVQLGPIFELSYTFGSITDDNDNFNYCIAVLGNVICKGYLLVSDTLPGDLDIDLLICDAYDPLMGFSLNTVDDRYPAQMLIDQIVHKQFRDISKQPSPQLNKRLTNLYAADWTNLTVQDLKAKNELKNSLTIVQSQEMNDNDAMKIVLPHLLRLLTIINNRIQSSPTDK